jgi:hypothetical protein
VGRPNRRASSRGLLLFLPDREFRELVNSKNLPIAVLCGLVLLILFQAPVLAKNRVADIRVRNLLHQGKEASLRGDQAQAVRLWKQALSLNPSLSRPPWLGPAALPPLNPTVPSEEETARFVPSATASSPRDLFLEGLAEVPYDQAKAMLADWLRRHPQDARVRAYFLERAAAAGDRSEERRHRSVLGLPDDAPASWPIGKLSILLILLAVVWWQGRAAWREYRQQRR